MNTQKTTAAPTAPSGAPRGASAMGRGPRGPQAQGGRGGNRPGDNRGRGRRDEREPQEFDQSIVELARVTRVTKGGKRMRFRASVIVGDRKGRVGFGVAKGADVQLAVAKATRQAKKHVIRVPLVRETIPYEVHAKFGAAELLLKPAPRGSGIIAGGALRTVLAFAGVPNVSSKMLGSKNKINNIKAAFVALTELHKLQRKSV